MRKKTKTMAEAKSAMVIVIQISTAGAPPQNLFCDERGLGMCPNKSLCAPVGAAKPSLLRYPEFLDTPGYFVFLMKNTALINK